MLCNCTFKIEKQNKTLFIVKLCKKTRADYFYNSCSFSKRKFVSRQGACTKSMASNNTRKKLIVGPGVCTINLFTAVINSEL
jgi:hypothetical protein